MKERYATPDNPDNRSLDVYLEYFERLESPEQCAYQRPCRNAEEHLKHQEQTTGGNSNQVAYSSYVTIRNVSLSVSDVSQLLNDMCLKEAEHHVEGDKGDSYILDHLKDLIYLKKSLENATEALSSVIRKGFEWRYNGGTNDSLTSIK